LEPLQAHFPCSTACERRAAAPSAVAMPIDFFQTVQLTSCAQPHGAL
jgi:hypothetical protein